MCVAVVGAGIVGLTTAAHIQDLLPGVKVTVIADKFNTDTTSDGAAGLFYPVTYFKGPTPASPREWLKYSFEYYKDLLNQDCGVYEISGFVLSSRSEQDVQCELMDGVATEYRPATPQEMLRYLGNWKYGTFARSLLIRCRTFQPWLIERIMTKGGQVVKKTIENFSELKGQYNIIVNCTGLQSRYLCGDNTVAPIRGQIIKVRAPNVDQFVMAESLYIIPNCDGLVSLGGTTQYGHWNTAIRPHDSEGIRARCIAVVPELKSAPVAWEWAGLRPFRETVRVEPEIRDGLQIVHNYGHGGQGVTLAPGTAKDAANFVQQMLQAQSKL